VSDRGDYRSFYTSLADDTDFQELDPLAFKVLFVLKLALGAAGIGIARKLVLCEQVGCGLDDLERSMKTLEAPKKSSGEPWIRREFNVIWILNGLKFEPTLTPENVKKHRPYVRRLVAPLGDKPIVRDFVAYYAPWFDSCPVPPPDDSHRIGTEYPNDTLSVGERYTATKPATKTATGNKASDSDSAAGHESGGTLSGDGTAVARSLEIARGFFAEFYSDANDRLKRQVWREMQEVMAEGVIVEGQRVRAFSQQHLDDMLLETLREGGRIEKPHSAWRYTLKKLSDTSRRTPGRVTGEQMAKAQEQRDAESRRYELARTAEVERWRKGHADEYAAIEAQAKAARPEETPLGDIMRQGIIQDEVAKAINFPDFEHWEQQRRAS
jgi:hypothetical protein